MTTKNKSLLNRTGAILVAVLSCFTILGVAWSTVLMPQVDKRIDMKIECKFKDQGQTNKELLEITTEIRERVARIEGKLQ